MQKVQARRRQRAISSTIRAQWPMFVLFVMLLALSFGGGASRPYVASLIVVRPVLALGCSVLLLLPGQGQASGGARFPILLLGLFALIMAVQLVSLPPSVWQRLPSRASYAEVAVLAGQSQSWLPISVVPVLTLNSLFSLLSPLALFMSGWRLTPKQYSRLLEAVLIIGVASCITGVLQIVGGDRSFAYLYDYARPGFSPGLFANRNHQAAFLAAMLPLDAAWALLPSKDPRATLRRWWGAGLVAILFLIMIVMTGSRSGLGLSLLGLSGAVWLILRQFPVSGGRARTSTSAWRVHPIIISAAIVFCAVIVILLPLLAGRGAVFERLLEGGGDASATLRLAALPVTLRLIIAHLPFGSGFGTFDPVFRAIEPDSLLAPGYFNNAHNDLIELAITGGIPALVVLMVFLIWLGRRAYALMPFKQSASVPLSAAMFLVIMLLASLSDYPLRTPLLGGLFGLMTALVASTNRSTISKYDDLDDGIDHTGKK